MLTWHCPKCGQKHSIREGTIGNIKRCDGCGSKSPVAPPPPSPAPAGLAAVIIAVCIFVVCGGCLATFGGLSGINKTNETQAKAKPSETNAGQTPAPKKQPAEKKPNEEETRPKKDPEPTPEELAVIEQEKKEREAKNNAEIERFEREEEAYKMALASYEGARKLRLAQSLARAAIEESENGNGKMADEIKASAKKHYREILRDYPGTEAATAARLLLDGKTAKEIEVPKLPIKPKPAHIVPEPPTKRKKK